MRLRRELAIDGMQTGALKHDVALNAVELTTDIADLSFRQG
jgi:hypothetical protein